jgi:cholesterol transport system auxiliary component
LLRQRLREHLSQRRAVLNPADGVQTATPALTLRLDLDEFSQIFEAPERSSALVRVRATLAQPASGSEQLVAQRSFVLQRPSPSPDAAGGVHALTAAADAVILEIDQWVQQATQANNAPGSAR